MVFDSDKYSLQIESTLVSDAELTEVKPANLGCFSIDDQLTPGADKYSLNIGERLLGENHGAISPSILPNGRKWWHYIYMVRHHYYRTCVANGIPKKSALSVISVNL